MVHAAATLYALVICPVRALCLISHALQGLSAAGAVLLRPDGSTLASVSRFLGADLTNNEAEYMVSGAVGLALFYFDLVFYLVLVGTPGWATPGSGASLPQLGRFP